jgi:diphosphomevalonate decarboxylase
MSPIQKNTAIGFSNIAFIKYWGNRDHTLRLPENPSLSMNLDGLETRTTVEFIPGWEDDQVIIGENAQVGEPKQRVREHLDRVRALAGMTLKARVESRNNFPAGAGIASSASAFAALTLAACAAADLELSEAELSALARQGSGSAARSVPGGFTEWQMGAGSADSYAFTIAAPNHWALWDVIAVISQKHKAVGSTGGHALAHTSPLQAARVATAPARLTQCREAVLRRDFATLAEVVEADSNLMHAVMLTSTPPLFYWEPITLAIMKAVRRWRNEGLPVCYTIDAGANVHCLCLAEAAAEVERRLRENLDVRQIFKAKPGGPAKVIA